MFKFPQEVFCWLPRVIYFTHPILDFPNIPAFMIFVVYSVKNSSFGNSTVKD